MKYTTTETKQEKVEKNTKFDIGDIVSYEDPDTHNTIIFVINRIRINNNWQATYPDNGGLWISDALTLVSKANKPDPIKNTTSSDKNTMKKLENKKYSIEDKLMSIVKDKRHKDWIKRKVRKYAKLELQLQTLCYDKRNGTNVYNDLWFKIND